MKGPKGKFTFVENAQTGESGWVGGLGVGDLNSSQLNAVCKSIAEEEIRTGAIFSIAISYKDVETANIAQTIHAKLMEACGQATVESIANHEEAPLEQTAN